MINLVERYILANKMISPGDRVIVAVSGGPDSMALLHVLHCLSPQLKCELVAAHLNHGLRAEADAEQRFVETCCRDWGIPFYARKLDIGSLAAAQKRNVEDLGRQERYRFFDELADELSVQRIATAHHEDDQAETVLMRLIRGTGLRGLRGILPVQGRIIRPLLTTSKETLLAYLEANSLDYCTDQSNFDPAYLRNRVRHHLMPLLREEFNPQMSKSLSQLARIALDEEDWMEEETRRLWPVVLLKQNSAMISLDLQKTTVLHPALQRRIYQKAMHVLGGEEGWSLEDVESVVDLSSRPGSSRWLKLKKQVRVHKSYDTIVFTTEEPGKKDFCYPVEVPGIIEIEEAEQAFSLQIAEYKDLNKEPACMYLDYDKLPMPLFIRSRRQGDRFHPIGMQGSKKIKSLFMDLKIPFLKRDKVPLLTSEEDIVYAVLGYHVSRLAMVSHESKRILVIKPTLLVKNIKDED